MYTIKYNLSFLSSDHASKLLVMFPDSEIVQSFGSGHNKTAAVIAASMQRQLVKCLIHSPIN